jgi:uncharacterized cupredoxin-like copper-binding protein
MTIHRVGALVSLAAWALVTATAPALSAERASRHGEIANNGSGTDGVPGKASAADRTVQIDARDVAFSVKEIRVHPGETVRFVVRNLGRQRHEFVIASHAEHLEHRAMMRTMPNMKMGDEANAVELEPGETKELVWKFGRDADVEFACDLPGHAEVGMSGSIIVEGKTSR